MASTRKNPNSEPRKRPPAKTPDARENQLIALASDLAEKQLREGTASSQVISHYLKLGSSSERLAQEKVIRDIELAENKVEMMKSAQRTEELFEKAIAAMRSYGGVSEDPTALHD